MTSDKLQVSNIKYQIKKMEGKYQNLKDRTKLFALRVIKLVKALPYTLEGKNIGNQLFRSGTSVGANYRAACRARSRADFIAKMSIVEEEIDESAYWIEIIVESNIIKKELLLDLLKEAYEILAIVVSSKKTARKNN